MEGWIKLHRTILENPIVCKDAAHFAVWSYLLLNATHTERRVIFDKEEMVLKSGQLITGRKVIAEKFNIDESKVQRILKTFENAQQIEQQTSNKNRLISIVRWEEYQQIEQQIEQRVNNKCTTNAQQMHTNKNDKKGKNEKNNNISKDIYVSTNADTSGVVIEKWNSLNLSKVICIKNNRAKMLQARIKEYSLEKVIEAIDNIKDSNFLKGQNNRGWIIDIDWFLKPNNFPKVLEGNYLNKDKKSTSNTFNEF